MCVQKLSDIFLTDVDFTISSLDRSYLDKVLFEVKLLKRTLKQNG
jgi:hypothetical protein